MTGTGLRTEPRELLFRLDEKWQKRPVLDQNKEVYCYQQLLGEEYVLSLCTLTGSPDPGNGKAVTVELFNLDEFGTMNY